MQLEMCPKCHGTGHKGHCECCGGSGFIGQATTGSFTSVPKKASFLITWPGPDLSSSLQNPTRQVTPSTKPVEQAYDPREMTPDEQFLGLRTNQLVFPANQAGFEVETLRKQIQALVKQYPGLRVIRWTGPSTVIVTQHDGAEAGLVFPVKRSKAPAPQKRSTSTGSRRAVCQQERTESIAQQSVITAPREASLDGSKGWSGFRDSPSGRFGSYPAFDPSADYEE